jgi:hypothetical protein
MCHVMKQVSATRSEGNKKAIRKKAASIGIFTITDLARKAGCSRWSIYQFMKCPALVPRVANRLGELLDA